MFIKGTVEPRQWGKDKGDLQFKLQSIQWLSEVRDKYLQALTLDLYSDNLTDELVEELSALAEKYKGQKKLNVTIRNDKGVKVVMYSSNYQIDVSNEFLKYLDLLENVKYRIN